MKTWRTILLAAIVLAVAPSANAHHRQTPPVVPLTASGDTPLPRVPAPGNKTLALALQVGNGTKIVAISPWKNRQDPAVQTIIVPAGDHANPAVSAGGRTFAFDSGSDPLGLGQPGRQVLSTFVSSLFAVSNDPSGTSENPSIDTSGLRVAFESTGDLTDTGDSTTRRIFLRERDGSVREISRGLGTSRNPILSAKQHRIAFQSTSDPETGVDTGVSQIWLGTLDSLPAPITNGLGPSFDPAFSNDGRILVFVSTADLGADIPNDTGVPQVYAYDTKSKTYARVTNDALGCTLPSVFKAQRDWRIAFVCSGQPYFYMLRGDQRYRVAIDGGTAQRVVAELGIHFLVVSTNANLLEPGLTAGNQVYLVNLFKRPGQPVPGQATWFPTRGIPPL